MSTPGDRALLLHKHTAADFTALDRAEPAPVFQCVRIRQD